MVYCPQNSDGSIARVEQLSVDHNTSNEDELRRLAGCGLDPNMLRRHKRLGMQQNTRSIGDHSIKGGYTNVDILRSAMIDGKGFSVIGVNRCQIWPNSLNL